MSVAENPMTFFKIFQLSQPHSAQRPQATRPAQQGNTASLPAVATASGIWGPGVAEMLRNRFFFLLRNMCFTSENAQNAIHVSKTECA